VSGVGEVELLGYKVGHAFKTFDITTLNIKLVFWARRVQGEYRCVGIQDIFILVTATSPVWKCSLESKSSAKSNLRCVEV
jgi:hypothetical protein